MIARLRNESGQALVVTALFMSATIGGTALTLDVGSWYREHRQAQTTADAAALSSAQSLPGNTVQAISVANTYGTKNGGGIDPTGGVTFRSDFEPNDTVIVNVTRTAPGFFSKLFGIDSVQVHASAAARSAVPMDVRWAAPIAVNKNHPMLAGAGCPCFNVDTTIPLGKNGAPGSFAIVDLNNFAANTNNGACLPSPPGNAGTPVVADWIANGFSDYLLLGCYDSDPGAKFNSSQIAAALQERIGSTLLFPVYDTEVGQGSNAQYHVIGFAAFYIDGFAAQGSIGDVSGHFTQVIWDGVQSATAPTGPDFGVHSIALVN
jgi:hypothetical protein